MFPAFNVEMYNLGFSDKIFKVYDVIFSFFDSRFKKILFEKVYATIRLEKKAIKSKHIVIEKISINY